MSGVRTLTEGHHSVVVASAEQLAQPSTVVLPEAAAAPGLILPNGDINWACPCLGGMAAGPCGMRFREAFSCFHYSTSEPKGSECFEKFSEMQNCMSQYPELYGRDDDGDEAQLPGAEELAASGGDQPAAGGGASKPPSHSDNTKKQ